MNPYAYVDGDPISLIDPTGLVAAPIRPIKTSTPYNASGPVMGAVVVGDVAVDGAFAVVNEMGRSSGPSC